MLRNRAYTLSTVALAALAGAVIGGSPCGPGSTSADGSPLPDVVWVADGSPLPDDGSPLPDRPQ